MPEDGKMSDSDHSANLRTAYEQLCTSYRSIDDFRAKLLGFLPLVTGGGVLLLAGQGSASRDNFFTPAGLFGLAVTAGLLAYELFGIKKCHALLEAGEDLEQKMELPIGQDGRPAGQFVQRPPHLLKVVNEPFAAAAIYPAVLAAWTYLALFDDHRDWGRTVSLAIFLFGFVSILLYDRSLKRPKRHTHSGLEISQVVSFLRRRSLRRVQEDGMNHQAQGSL
jgi:hypothetical protein